MYNEQHFPDFYRMLIQTEHLLALHNQDSDHYRLIQRALGKLRAEFAQDKVIPALLAPGLCWQALGRASEPALDGLNAAHFLFYAFLDLTDDAEDQDLDPRLWQNLGPALAVNTGTSLLFLAFLMLQELTLLGVRAEIVARLHQLFSQAGWLLSCGQHRDLSFAQNGKATPKDVLKTHALKTGTSVSLYLHSAAVLAEASLPQQQGMADLGQALGVMVQIRGDWLDLFDPRNPISSDFENHCINLPLALLEQSLNSADRDLYLASHQTSKQGRTAHDLVRYLLNKYDIIEPANDSLESYRQQAHSALLTLQNLGCETTALSHFVERIIPLTQKNH